MFAQHRGSYHDRWRATPAPVSPLFHRIDLGRRLDLVPVGLLAAEFIEAAKHEAAQVVLPPILRPGLNLHSPHVDFHDVVLAVFHYDAGRRDNRLVALIPKMLDLSSAHTGNIGFARPAGKNRPSAAGGGKLGKAGKPGNPGAPKKL